MENNILEVVNINNIPKSLLPKQIYGLAPVDQGFKVYPKIIKIHNFEKEELVCLAKDIKSEIPEESVIALSKNVNGVYQKTEKPLKYTTDDEGVKIRRKGSRK